MVLLTVAEEAVAVVCLQARHVTSVPAAVHHIHLQCSSSSASAVDSRGVADFRSEVLLLHCGAGAQGSSLVVDITVSVSPFSPCHLPQQQQQQIHLVVDWQGGGDKYSPSRRVLSFVLGGAAAGAVLTLELHQRLLRPPPATTTTSISSSRSRYSCVPACCRRSKTRRRRQRSHLDSSSDDGYIVIEKQGRRRPSESLASTDDNTQKLELDHVDGRRVEDEFLAILEMADADADLELELDMLIKDAEEELAIAHLLKDQDAIHDVD